MPKTVQLMGLAPNILELPPAVDGVERWGFNDPRGYRIKNPLGLSTWTRWFNLHSQEHQTTRYPGGVAWYRKQDGTRPIYFQRPEDTHYMNHDPQMALEAIRDTPGGQGFPRREIQEFFRLPDGTLEGFFTCSLTWAIAFAIYEGFERIEFWGFELKRGHQYDYERPGTTYWIARARAAGVDVVIQEGVDLVKTPKLYGYETA